MSELFPTEVSPAQSTSDVAVQLSRQWRRNESTGEVVSSISPEDAKIEWLRYSAETAYGCGLRDGAMAMLAVLMLAGAVLRIGLEIFAP